MQIYLNKRKFSHHKKGSAPAGAVWNTNKAAVSLGVPCRRVVETIVSSLLCCGVGIFQCLFNLLYYVSW